MIHVLIVDDSPAFLDVAAHEIGRIPGCDVAGRAESGREALARVAQLHPDLVLLDIALPDMSGIEVAQQIKKLQLATRVVLVSLSNSAIYRATGEAVGADGFIPKDEIDTQLPALVSRLFPAARAAHAPAAPAAPEELGTIWDASPCAMLLADMQGVVIALNPACKRLCGYERSSLRGALMESIVLDPGRARTLRDMLAAAQPKVPTPPVELAIRHADGSVLHVEAQASLLWREPESLVLFTLHNLTERKFLEAKLRQHEDQRRQWEQQMLETQKLERLGLLTGSVAHDFNNILTSIKAYADLSLLELPPDSDATRESLSAISSSARYAMNLTRQLLNATGRRKQQRLAIDLSQFVRDLDQLLQVACTKNCSLVYHLAERMPPIELDTAQLIQIVLNFAVNACEAIGEDDGTIIITTEVRDMAREQLGRLLFGGGLAPGRYIGLSVSDTGCGMDAATLERVFEPFFTTKAHGRGLGLASTQHIVREIGGAMYVESALGEGTIFQVWFPIAP